MAGWWFQAYDSACCSTHRCYQWLLPTACCSCRCRSHTSNNYNTLYLTTAWTPSDTYSGGGASTSISTSKVDLNLDLTTGMTASVVKARTFFVAPRSGPHTFMIAGDDYLQLNATYLDVSSACCWLYQGCRSCGGM